MGYRHQVYLVTANNLYKPWTPENQRVSAVHIQELDERRAVGQLVKTLRSLSNSYAPSIGDGFDPRFYGLTTRDNDRQMMLQALYSIDPFDGQYALIHDITEERCPQDPRAGEIESGITVIDARDFTNLRYAFCIGHDDMKRDHEKRDVLIKAFQPMDAMTYMYRQYPKNPDSYWRTRQDYEKDGRIFGRKFGIANARMQTLNRQLSKYSVLAQADIYNIWPVLKPKKRKQAA